MSINFRDSDNLTPLLLCIMPNSSDHEHARRKEHDLFVFNDAIPCNPCAATNSDQKTRLELRKKTPPPPLQSKKWSRTDGDAIRYRDCENMLHSVTHSVDRGRGAGTLGPNLVSKESESSVKRDLI